MFTFANGQILTVSSEQLDHLAAHPEVTTELLKVAVSKITPGKDKKGNHFQVVNLFDEFGMWGKCGLIKLKNPISIYDNALFGFRGQLHGNSGDRLAPSHVVEAAPVPTSLLAVCFELINDTYHFKTAFASSPHNVGIEPITPNINPFTKEGLEMRKAALKEWCQYALAVETASLREPAFVSTWVNVIKQYGNVYHT